ncbi:MAG: GlmU family protein [Ekhidna sp.]|nr:GlmU family protein [Ekhidna sp.]
MQVTFFDTEESWCRMLPISYTRPVAEVRIGILKISEKWSKALDNQSYSFYSQHYLTPLFKRPELKSLFIKGSLLPDDNLINMMKELSHNEVLVFNEELIAGFFEPDEPIRTDGRKTIEVAEVTEVKYPWNIFRLNGLEIKSDFETLTSGRTSQKLQDTHTRTYGKDIFIEEGAQIKAATLNAENGPIYIGKGAELREGSLIRGPFAVCEHSVVNMGAKIRGDTTIGPYSKVGGEVSNSIIQGYSNKGHDGFLGNSVLGEWCNLGADTNNSNLKNNYTNVKMWNFETGGFKDTGLQFCGLIMGDHSKCGINTMFNTGTTVGISANIFGAGFQKTNIPSFAWGGAPRFTTYLAKKAFEAADLVMERKKKKLTEADKSVLSHIFEMTSKHRTWEK